MKKYFIIALLIFSISSWAQSVQRQGKVFVAQRDTMFVNTGTPTEYEYQERDGKKYTIYLSKNKKAYIVRISRNGRRYKKYLPDVTKEINK